MLELLQNTAKETGIFTLQLIVIGAIFFFIEKIRPAEKNTHFIKSDFKQELGLAVLNTSVFYPIINAIFAIAILKALIDFLPYQIFNEQLSTLPLLLQVLAACFIMDFATYWRHRTTHRVKWLWPFHSIHHAAKNVNWLTSARLHPVDVLVATIFDVVILHIFGFEATGIAIAVLVIGLYNFFTHANIDLKFQKPIRYIFASPNFHRWHHATEKSAYDKNFCAMFSLLDVMFGTYYHPEDLPEGYGLEPQEQELYPKSMWGWLTYPFQKLLQK